MQPTASAEPKRSRLQPIDWMRGLVMVLMTVDHSSDAFNGGRVFTDAAFAYHPGMALPPAQYLTRWITHLCAPTFVFLAGASLAMMARRRRALGESEWSIDQQMIIRGLFIAALDPLWMSLGFMGWHRLIFQVLYGIGMSMVCLALLRRLPSWALVALALAIMVGVELLVAGRLSANSGSRGDTPWPIALLVSGGSFEKVFGLNLPLIVAYPVAPWLAIMMIGFAVGRWLGAKKGEGAALAFLIGGAASLTLFALLRGLNGFGNMALLRDDDSIIQWIHVAKYPPSITYCALELGIMCLFLSLFFALHRAGNKGEPRWTRLLQVLGSTAMFYYLFHVHLLMAASYLLGVHEKLGLGAAWLAAAACVAVLYYPCLRYGRYKARNSNWFTRLV